MKKALRNILIALLIMASLVSLAACGKKPETGEDVTEEVDTSYDPADYVELCDYKNVPVTDDEVTVSDKDAADFLRSELDKLTQTKEITDRGVKEGDLVSINIKGYLNGKSLDTLEAYYFELMIGEGTLGDEFDDALIGVKRDETKKFDISYDKDYPSENLAGNTINYEVRVNYILEITEYELNDENIKLIGNGAYQTVDDAMNAAKVHLLENDFTTYRNRYLLKKLVDSCTVKEYPEPRLSVYKADMVTEYGVQAMNAGAEDLESYLKAEYGMTMEDFTEYVDQYCKAALKEEMVYTLIARKENITLTDEEYDLYLSVYTEAYANNFYYSMTTDEFAEQLGKENVEQALTIKKTQELITRWNAKAES